MKRKITSHCMASTAFWCSMLIITLSLVGPLTVSANTVVVADIEALSDAIAKARPGDSIVVLPGHYFLQGLTLAQNGASYAPITLRAAVPRQSVLWIGRDGPIEVRAEHWQIQDLDFQGFNSAGHALRLVGGADRTLIEGNLFQNFDSAIRLEGEGEPPLFPDHGRILRNAFVNNTPRNSWVAIAAMDIVGGQNWQISENFISDMALDRRGSARSSAGILVRGGAAATVIDRNLIMCEWRHTGGQRTGLSLGGEGTHRRHFDRRGLRGCATDCPEVRDSRITNNVILNCPDEPGIYLNKATDALIANNTIFNAFGIQARFPETRVETVDNLLSGTIWQRDRGMASSSNDLATGWFDWSNRLPAVKRKLQPSVADHRIIYFEGFDRWVRWGLDTARGLVERLAASFLGKGLAPFDTWFFAANSGDLRLHQGDEIIAAGSNPPRVRHDFCGQRRMGPGDRGAFEYKAGNCELVQELRKRHGDLVSTLLQQAQVPPPDWRVAGSEPDLAGVLPTPLRVLDAGPEDFRAAVSGLQPGDWLRLAPGEYTGGLQLQRLRGTAENPIVISGSSAGDPAVLVGRRGANLVSLRDSAYVVIRHLTLDGRGNDIGGVVAEEDGIQVHDVVLEHLRIRNFDAGLGNAAIGTRVPAWNWVIRHNDIRDVGTGLYLGQSDGSAPFIGGLIENNVIAETLGYNAQIKHQKARDRLPGMPTEPRQTLIRYNIFSKAENGQSGAQARPNLLLGHFPPEGPGVSDRYLVYGNLFHENPHERLFQGEGNLVIYNNLFLNRGGNGLIVMRHNGVPKDVQILRNTVVAEGVGIALTHPDRDYRQVVAGNAVFAGKPLRLPRSINSKDNFTADRAAALTLLNNPDAGLDTLNLYPQKNALREAIPIDPVDGLPGLEDDYNGRPRQGSTWGAYGSGHGTNPGRSGGVGPNVPGCAFC